jgi:transcriptional regulator with XRE-family HTH domain
VVKRKLLEARLNKGLSQEKLADLIDMSQPNYSRRENGLKNISAVEWAKIAKVLGVKKEEIYEKNLQTTFYKSTNDNNTGNRLPFNIPEFVLDHIESLKGENKELKEKLKKYEV